jgi:diguanylate cyclase (GGDEF)-like protein
MARVVRGVSVGKKPTGLSKAALASFLGSLAFCTFLAGVTIVSMLNVEMLKVEQLMYDQTFRTNVVISKLIYKTNSLAAIVMHGNGIVIDFERTAPLIADDPAVLNVLVAPDGIVSHVYPATDGHDAVLGWNFFDEGLPGNREAVLAVETGALTLSGPFRAAQGSKVLAGRLPVYIDTPDEKGRFWGLVSVTLKFPEVLQDTELELFRVRGLEYEIWRINPDNGNKQVLMTNAERGYENQRYLEKMFTVVNADWHFKVWPIRYWYSYPQSLVLLASALMISLLVFSIMQNNFRLAQMKLVLEDMAKSDPLTGIYNRRHFMDIARMNTERARRLKTDCYIILFDLDRFKSVNDTYGHQVGDKVLIETSTRVKSIIRPYDLFARYGGEEFIIFASELDKKCVTEMVERLRVGICENKYLYDEDLTLGISSSFGIAHINDYDIEKAILHADKALYKAKDGGRNRVAFWNSCG